VPTPVKTDARGQETELAYFDLDRGASPSVGDVDEIPFPKTGVDSWRLRPYNISMNFRRVASVGGWSACVIGLFLMLYGPLAIPFLGAFMHQDYGSYSLIRLAGVGLGLVGALLLAVKEIVDPGVQRRISLAMILAHLLGGLIIWARHIAIWNSPAGAILAVWFTLMPAIWLPLGRPHAVNEGVQDSA